ncbi:MAG: hypothetical protein K2W92_08015 [Alphaproteobacteria bacterium]|nr:hypothetical protein [Alphaproteobacteria bacterium]
MSVHHQHHQISVNVDDFVTIRQLTTSNPAFTEGGIRALIFRAEQNGFNRCIHRIGFNDVLRGEA